MQRLEGILRLCRADDLPKLEWFGAYTPHRQIIAEAFADQERNCGFMLVCEVNAFPVAQVWVKFLDPDSARLWALRVMELFQKRGIGEQLVMRAEEMLIARGFRTCEIGVTKGNVGVRRFYERLGYNSARSLFEQFTYVIPSGEVRRESADQWILSKTLSSGAD